MLLNEKERDRAEYFSMMLNTLITAIDSAFGGKESFAALTKLLNEILEDKE